MGASLTNIIIRLACYARTVIILVLLDSLLPTGITVQNLDLFLFVLLRELAFE
jgi:hypothetical protein